MLKRFFARKYQTLTHEISEPLDGITIDIDTGDVSIFSAKEAVCRVVCRERRKAPHTVAVKGGTLVIEPTSRALVSFYKPQINVYIPAGKCGDLQIKSKTGKAIVEGISATSLALSAVTGRVDIAEVACERDITITLNTGGVSLKNTVARGKLFVRTKTGGIQLDGCDATELSLKSNTGSVSGTLLSEKVFCARSKTGRITLPQITSVGKCEIQTNTGKVKIEIKE